MPHLFKSFHKILKTALNKHNAIINANVMNEFQRLSVIALCSTSLGIGILRFAYTAIMPMTIDQHWWNSAFAHELANANLLGYFIGAILAIKSIPETWISRCLIISALFGSLSLLACGFANLPTLYYLFWRLISGIAGGLLMVLGPSYALKQVAIADKPRLSLIAFSGIGIGILLSTTLLPQLDVYSVAIAWWILGGLGFILTLFLYLMLNPKQHKQVQQSQIIVTTAPTPTLMTSQLYSVILIITAYFLSALGYIPHSIYWVDFAVHQLHHSQNFANLLWMIYGFGAVFGALATYLCLQRYSNYASLWRLYTLYSIAVFLPFYFTQTTILVISSFLAGMLNPATVSLTASLLSEITPGHLQRQIWGIAVLVFATAQCLGGYFFAYLLHHALPYQQIFLIASCVLTLATVIGLYLIKKNAPQPTRLGDLR